MAENRSYVGATVCSGFLIIAGGHKAKEGNDSTRQNYVQVAFELMDQNCANE